MTTVDHRTAPEVVPDPRHPIDPAARAVMGELALEHAGEVLDRPETWTRPGASLLATRMALRVVAAQLHHAMADSAARRSRARHRPECVQGPLRCVCELNDNVEPF